MYQRAAPCEVVFTRVSPGATGVLARQPDDGFAATPRTVFVDALVVVDRAPCFAPPLEQAATATMNSTTSARDQGGIRVDIERQCCAPSAGTPG
jgi:hypothetical protein